MEISDIQQLFQTKRPFFHPLAYKFQENLLRTMIQIENTYFELAKSSRRNVLVGLKAFENVFRLFFNKFLSNNR